MRSSQTYQSRYPPQQYPKRIQYRKKRYNKKQSGTDWSSVASTALKTAKWVAGLVNAEYKYWDVSPSLPIASTYNGYITGPLCAPPQGVDVESRTGDSIKMVNLTMRLLFQFNGLQYENVRVIIFHDKENSITNVSDFLDITGSQLAVLSPKNQVYQYDSKTIFDKTYSISSNTPQVLVDQVFKLNMHSHFQASTTTVKNNAIKMIIIGQQPTSGTTFQYFSKITYLDN